MQWKEYMEEIIFRHLNHEASQKEQAELAEWLRENPANQQEYDMLVKIWLESSNIANARQFDVAKAWAAIDSKINKTQNRTTISRSVALTSKNMLWAAAVLLLIFTAGVFYYTYKHQGSQVTAIEARLANMQIRLPDGSSVSLRKGSTLNYPGNFGTHTRNLQFSGEAFFEVAHNEQLPFRITFHNSIIEVLGTSFLLRSFNHTEQVFVAKGKVRFADIKDSVHAIILTAGQKASYNGTVFEEDNITDTNYLSWKNGILEFNNVPLGKMVDELSHYYGVNIKLSNELAAKSDTLKVNFRFEKNSLEEALEEIRLATGLMINRDKNSILLYSK